MSYKYKFTDKYCILNFSEEYPTTSIQLVESAAFEHLLVHFIRYCKVEKRMMYNYLSRASMDSDDVLVQDMVKICKLLLIMNKDEICDAHKRFAPYFADCEMLLELIEQVYLFWRRFERYGIILNKHDLNSLEGETFLEAQSKFRDLVLQTYRRFESMIGHENLVYRQIIAGLNAGLNLNLYDLTLPDEYASLQNIPMIDQVTIHPPFITYSKSHKRAGMFEELDANPLAGKDFNQDEWFCYPAKVGNLIVFVYFNVEFLHHGVSLSNLFAMAEPDEFIGKKPDLIYVCGYVDGAKKQCFYQDKKNDIVVGYLSLDDGFDYFGYMKKMILTLHNIKKINEGRLPIHGAMVEILFNNGQRKTVIIMGDSGAGKSETIDQIKNMGADVIDSIKTIYDDMGVLVRKKDGQIVSSGTEIGAFVRLNDLDSGYGYKELDRSVFMNPDKINARVVVPTATWSDVVKKYKFDYFMYANNYEQGDDIISFFDNTDAALEVFEKGRRMAKGTTSEQGISESFFANPFGPAQREEQTKKLLRQYFDAMFEQGIKVGQINTCLGINDMIKQGPKNAAKAFLDLLAK